MAEREKRTVERPCAKCGATVVFSRYRSPDGPVYCFDCKETLMACTGATA